jgi:hypothetical protein
MNSKILFSTVIFGLTTAACFSGVAQASSMTIANESSVFSFGGYDGQPASVTGTKKYGETGTLKTVEDGIVTFTYLGQESSYWDSLKLNVNGKGLTEFDPLGKSVSVRMHAGNVNFSFLDDTNHDGHSDHSFTNGSSSTGAFGYAFLMDQFKVAHTTTSPNPKWNLAKTDAYNLAHCHCTKTITTTTYSYNYDFAHTATIASGLNKGTYLFDYLLGFNDSYVKGKVSKLGDSDYDDFVVGVSFTPSPVPLPAALPLMLSGIGILGFASRRRKNEV